VISLERFSVRISGIGAKVAQEADRVTRQVALLADQTVVLATPVDTGRARSNWIVQLDTAPRRTIDPYVPGDTGSTAAANVSEALAQGSSEISRYDGDKNVAIVISNNLPYIGRLNDGYSRQAPSGFVERAIQAAVQRVRGARLLP
jgi:hypothetical protein